MCKKIFLAAFLILILPGFILAQPYCSKEGDPAFYVGFGEDTRNVIAGETVCWTLGPANFGFVSGSCPDADTFCVRVYDTKGWVDTTCTPPCGDCNILDAGYLWWQDICVNVPCDVYACDFDTIHIQLLFCNTDGVCDEVCIEIPECEDPNWYGGNPYYSTDTVILHVVESPPSLYIVQDSVYHVEQGQTAAYVPFTICNGDACADPTVYNYTISCTPLVGTICTGFPQAGSTAPVPGGEYEDVYGIVNASAAGIDDKAELEIIAWVDTVYDTCVQIVEVIEPVPVPLFSAPVVTVLVLAMILAAAVLMRRRAANRA